MPCHVEVFVWACTLSGMGRSGHAALALNGVPNGDPVRYPRQYISWWPEGDDEKTKTPFGQVSGAQMGRTFEEDRVEEMGSETRYGLAGVDGYPQLNARAGQVRVPVSGALLRRYSVNTVKTAKAAGDLFELWGQDPKCVEIPVIDVRTMYGLDSLRMYRWWEAVTVGPHKKTYDRISTSQNCALIVGSALKAGYAGSFVEAPLANFWMDPNQVWKWANAVRAKIDGLNKKAVALGLRDNGMSPNEYQDLRAKQADGWNLNVRNDRLISLDAWRRSSYVGVLAQRKDQVKEIDSLIRSYHTLPQVADGESTDMKDKRLKTLDAILQQVYYYVVKKAGNKRFDAITSLGNHVLSYRKYLIELWDAHDIAVGFRELSEFGVY